MTNQATLARRIVAEAVGTALLLAAIVGSGIMADELAGGSVGLALLANSIAVGAALVALLLAFGPVSGAHFNPAVTVADAFMGGIKGRDVPWYIGAQVVGALVGTAAAHGMFGEPLYTLSMNPRSGSSMILSEAVATFGLLSVIWGCVRARSTALPFAVGAYITSAFWFTASTSFANPAVALARAMTDTFTGIRPADVPGFWLAQCVGAIAATALFRWLIPSLPARANEVALPDNS